METEYLRILQLDQPAEANVTPSSAKDYDQYQPIELQNHWSKSNYY